MTMKKRVIASLTCVLLIVLSGCGKNKLDVLSTDSSMTSEVKESTDMKELSRYKGTLKQDAQLDEESVSLAFDKVEAIQDSEGMIDSLNADGVVLNIDKKSLSKTVNLDELKQDVEVEFTLESPVMMTFSIPPQIAGNSVKTLKLLK